MGVGGHVSQEGQRGPQSRTRLLLHPLMDFEGFSCVLERPLESEGLRMLATPVMMSGGEMNVSEFGTKH